VVSSWFRAGRRDETTFVHPSVRQIGRCEDWY
jgi:hypothetical protein